MDRRTTHPDDDQLLERLRALGPVLDDLTREAMDDGSPRAAGDDRRGPDRYRRLVAAAAVVLLIVSAIGIAALVSRDDETVRANQPKTTTTTAQSDAALAALVAQRIDATEQCGPLPTRDQVPVPWPKSWDMVGSPECDTAYVKDPSRTASPLPVYLEPKASTPVAYWSAATGWIDATEYRDPAFDLERYRAAYRAELDARVDNGGN